MSAPLERLLKPAEVAKTLGCSEWWVKEQCRRTTVPFVRVGREYRFTSEHVREIVALLERRPGQQTASNGGANAPRRRVQPPPAEQVVQLRARPPRRRAAG
ncbi:helix-turn-helix domain-containing protein [Saccharothrix lopnurensis]|uniref:Helix-turn-helix domain-containing protein n=1 Tax=Saccharothrix lopnurensis TaxID=1670621 RepID=A0ABW1P551_9PSEU